MPGNFRHKHFMRHYQAQGFVLKIPGLCAGFAEAARLYFLMGNNKFYRLTQLIQYLAHSEPSELCAEMQFVKRTQDESDIAKLLLEIPEFFRTVSIFSQPQLYKNFLGNNISQPKVSVISAYVEQQQYPDFLRQQGGTQKIFSFPVVFEKNDTISTGYWQLLQYISKIATQSPPCRVCFCLDGLNHRIMLGYDGKSQQWQLADVEQLEKVDVFIHEEAILNEIFHALNQDKNATSIGFDTAIYCARNDFFRFKVILNKLHDYTVKLFNDHLTSIVYKNAPNNVKLSHLAAKFGYDRMLMDLACLNPKGLQEKTLNGALPLDIAIDQKQQEAINVLSEYIPSVGSSK